MKCLGKDFRAETIASVDGHYAELGCPSGVLAQSTNLTARHGIGALQPSPRALSEGIARVASQGHRSREEPEVSGCERCPYIVKAKKPRSGLFGRIFEVLYQLKATACRGRGPVRFTVRTTQRFVLATVAMGSIGALALPVDAQGYATI
jgi:hypothetical protein